MKQSYNFDKDLDSIVKKKICAPLFMKNELLVPFSLLKLMKYICNITIIDDVEISNENDVLA